MSASDLQGKRDRYRLNMRWYGPLGLQTFLNDLENRGTFAAVAVDDADVDDERFVVRAVVSRPPPSDL